MPTTIAVSLVALAAGVILGSVSQNPQAPVDTPNLDEYQVAIERIAEAIEHLKPNYTQLVDFSARAHCDRSKLRISYSYNTHRAPPTGGWTSGVPLPAADGIWLYLEFHESASDRQIHRQPMVRGYRYRDMKVTFLVLEGEETEKLAGAIDQLLVANGVRPVRVR